MLFNFRQKKQEDVQINYEQNFKSFNVLLLSLCIILTAVKCLSHEKAMYWTSILNTFAGLTTSSIDDMSKFLIIATCCFGFLFLSVVLFMYYHFHKQKSSNVRAPLARTNRLAVSNVYAPSPVLSKPKFLQGDAENRTLGSMTTGSLYSNASLSSRDAYGNKRDYVNADFINRDISSLSSNRDYRTMNKHFSSKEFINSNEYEEVDVDRGTPLIDRVSLQTNSSNEAVREPENSSLRRLQNNRRPPTGRIKRNNNVPTASSDDDDMYVV